MNRAFLRRGGAAFVWLVLVSATASCGPDVDGLVDDLSRRDAAGQRAMLELLLTKDRAVPALLDALADGDRAAARPRLVEALASLMVRIADERIQTRLEELLAHDPDAAVRSAVAQSAGYYRLSVLAPALLSTGCYDDDGDVRHASLRALRLMGDKLTPQQVQAVRSLAAKRVDDPHRGVREEAGIRAEELVGDALDEARSLLLSAQVAAAESVYHQVLSEVPASKRANYRLARLAMARGDTAGALERFRRHGQLVDVPRLSSTPRIDGQLSEAVWNEAALLDDFHQFVSTHRAALPSEVRTQLRVAHDGRTLFLGFTGFDDAPQQILAASTQEDSDLWHDDMVEIFLDANLDRRSYVHVGVNSLATKADAWHAEGLRDPDETWDASIRVGAHVGADRWTAEVAIDFQSPHLPPPRWGALWGFNFVRTYRDAEYSQWVRTYGDSGHTPDDFGLMRFL